MLPLDTLLQHSLAYGAALSTGMSALIFATLYWVPAIWLADAPPEVQRAAGPLSPRARGIKRLIGYPMLAAIAGLLIHSAARLIDLGGGSATFGDLALSIFLTLQVFNLVDLVIIDWLVIVLWHPRALSIPGTEQMRGRSAYLFHFQGFLKGVVGSLVVSLAVAGAAVGLLAVAR